MKRWRLLRNYLVTAIAFVACLCLEEDLSAEPPKVAVASPYLAARVHCLSAGVVQVFMLRTSIGESLPYPLLEQRLLVMKECHYFLYDAREEEIIDLLCRERLIRHGVNAIEVRETRRQAGCKEHVTEELRQLYLFLREIAPGDNLETLNTNYHRELERLRHLTPSHLTWNVESRGLMAGAHPSKPGKTKPNTQQRTNDVPSIKIRANSHLNELVSARR